MFRGAFLLAGVAACCFAPRAFGGLMDWQIRSDEPFPLVSSQNGGDRVAAEMDMSGYGHVVRAFHAELLSMLPEGDSRQLSYEALVAVGAVPGTVTPPKAFGTNVSLGESVPEPSSAVLAILGVAALALRRDVAKARG